MKNRFRNTFARSAETAFRKLYSEIFNETGEKEVFSKDFIYENLEKPKDPRMGRFAFPVFRYGRLLKDKPPDIASKVVEMINGFGDTTISCKALGGFINVQTNFELESKDVLDSIITLKSDYGISDIGNNKRMLVEYSAPNIAKPFGIGHIRTTILGNALRKIFIKLGFDTIGLNYLGDWGTQFGKMIVAYKKWADESIKGKEKVSDLLELYVRFHEEAEQNPELEAEARLEFKKLEDGNPENTKMWESFRDISIDEFNRIYKLMGVEFDWVTGEAFLNDKMDEVIDRLDKAGLVSKSEGATIVDLQDEQLPPALLRKSDGATLYLTRDITGFLFRWDKYRFDEMLYVVASNQSVNFQQLFRVIHMLCEKENSDDISVRGKHIDFGLIKFQDMKMATRKGHIILLEDVFRKAADLAKEKIEEKNPDLKEIDKTSMMIGVGAVMFSQFSVKRQKEVNFVWEDVLSFEGETGPYLQYTHARLSSLLRNYDNQITRDINYELLNNDEEKRVIELLADFPEAVLDAGRNYEPQLIAAHLIRLAGAFNKFYQRKDHNGRIDKIISDDANLTKARIALVSAVRTVINEGLRLLGIESPEEM